MNVKIRKLHADAQVPAYATAGAAGFDLVAVEDVVIEPGETKKIPLGLAFEIPEGYVMYVCMRSGIALKTKLRQSNGIGVIDSDYRGEVAMMFDNNAWTDTDLRDAYEESPFVDYLDTLDGGHLVGHVCRFPHGSVRWGGPIGSYIVQKGERVAQAVIVPFQQAAFTVTDELSETERGAGGFGSTGTKSEEA